MLEVLDWQRAAEPRAVVRRAVETLQAGGTVAFPTQSSYALTASGLIPEAVERIRLNQETQPLAAAVDSLAMAYDWVPGISPMGQRLVRRFWPGPLTLLVADGLIDGQLYRLPPSVQQALSPDGALRLRCPAHEAILEAVQQIPGPLVVSEIASPSEGGVLPAQAEQQVDLLIDDGPSLRGQAATV